MDIVTCLSGWFCIWDAGAGIPDYATHHKVPTLTDSIWTSFAELSRWGEGRSGLRDRERRPPWLLVP
jgi:hypothetical protein